MGCNGDSDETDVKSGAINSSTYCSMAQQLRWARSGVVRALLFSNLNKIQTKKACTLISKTVEANLSKLEIHTITV